MEKSGELHGNIWLMQFSKSYYDMGKEGHMQGVEYINIDNNIWVQ